MGLPAGILPSLLGTGRGPSSTCWRAVQQQEEHGRVLLDWMLDLRGTGVAGSHAVSWGGGGDGRGEEKGLWRKKKGDIKWRVKETAAKPSTPESCTLGGISKTGHQGLQLSMAHQRHPRGLGAGLPLGSLRSIVLLEGAVRRTWFGPTGLVLRAGDCLF